MTRIENIIRHYVAKAIESIFEHSIQEENIGLDITKKEFIGDFTLVVFPYLKISKLNPEQTAERIGEYLIKECEYIQSYNVVKGFLNLEVSIKYWNSFLSYYAKDSEYGKNNLGKGEKLMIEYSSPNTNKPLHLGHIRNNLLGFSIAQIMQNSGYDVIKVNLINDRGIHICKSMLAWQKYGNGETPESSGIKGDHLVGKYYVAFDKHYKTQVQELVAQGIEEKVAESEAPLMKEAREMLIKWENNDLETVALWEKMNQWVYAGFNQTYTALGVDFDHFYYESNTYKLGKEIVEEGLHKKVFYKQEDSSVWIDLSAEKLDKKLLLRSDGTSVYMTQDLGTADLKYQDFEAPRAIYVVGNEQDYHFKVLFEILKKLERPYANGLYHLSYGMVDLPSGKMKSREGTVVDADDLIKEMVETAAKKSEESGKTEGMEGNEIYELNQMVGLGALKYYILKVDPSKRMLFNPEESIDFQGDTGPFIQYTHARIKSILRQIPNLDFLKEELTDDLPLHETEIETLMALYQFPQETQKAAEMLNPAFVAASCLKLARSFNRVYKEVSFLREENNAIKNNRLRLAYFTAQTIQHGMNLLGINVPERM
jgi:arginyl-tRNA synthetase